MTTANWKTQVFGKIMSLLYNNPHRVVEYRVRDTEGNCTAVNLCNGGPEDACASPHEPRAWSSPIFVDYLSPGQAAWQDASASAHLSSRQQSPLE